MDLGVISVRYARAFLKCAIDMKQEEVVYKDMQVLSQSFIQVPALHSTIDNPMLGKEKKISLLLTACGGNVTALTQRFLQLVLKEDRENILQFMAASYITLYRQQKNIIRGKLVTAVVVSPETEGKVKAMVESKTHGTVEFNTEVNPDIIGGFVLEYDTYRMDASVKTKLNTILNQLKK